MFNTVLGERLSKSLSDPISQETIGLRSTITSNQESAAFPAKRTSPYG